MRWIKSVSIGVTLLMSVVASNYAGPMAAGSYTKPDSTTMTSRQRKINGQLLRLDQRVRTEGDSIVAAAAGMGFMTTEDSVLLDISIDRNAVNIARKLSRHGAQLKHVSIRYGRVSAAINDVALLYELADLPEVHMIMPQYGARTHSGRRNGVVSRGHMKKP